MEEAPPSTSAVILGLSGVPKAGEIFKVVPDERTARAIVAKRKDDIAAKAVSPVRAFTLDDFSSRIQAGQVKELNLIVKTDVQGSIEPIVNSLEKLGDEELKVNVIHAAAGNISESDINLAIASHAVVVGFGKDRLGDSGVVGALEPRPLEVGPQVAAARVSPGSGLVDHESEPAPDIAGSMGRRRRLEHTPLPDEPVEQLGRR